MKKVLFFLILAGVVAFGGWYILRKPSEGPRGEENSRNTEELAGLEQKVLAFSIDGRSSKGARQWHLEGNSAEILEDEIHLQDLRAEAYGDDNTVNLVSERGIYRKDKGEVELIGNVRVTTSDGTLLTTDSAKWSQNTKEISTDDPVRIEREGLVAEGIGGMANSDKKTASLVRDVEVIMEPHTTVTCRGPLTVNSETNTAVFLEDVKVEDKDGKLFSDKLTVLFDKDEQKLSEVIAEGNVKVKRGNSYTISEKAVYSDSTKSARLEGKPRIIIDPQELEELDAL
ncbi:MAG: LPS export ABC transporter periplasmic protein LptC [Candidatus Omnitrophica bacterium]|nr:LPS export ABC transporter periplasmic protein LptC [Candidatus Omnitrophota bacterium]